MEPKVTMWIDGVSTDEVGIVLQEAPKLSAPIPRIETKKIAGKNGNLHFWDGSYDDRKLTVLAYVYKPEFVKNAFGLIHRWSFPKNGVVRIETSDDPDHFMLGVLTNGADVVSRIDRLVSFQLEFDCNPQRFLKSGEIPLSFDVKQDAIESVVATIHNQTDFEAKPILKFNLSQKNKQILVLRIESDKEGVLAFNIGGNSTAFEIDTDTNVVSDNAFDSDVLLDYFEGRKNDAYLGKKSKITVVGSGKIDRLTVIPRWWEL